MRWVSGVVVSGKGEVRSINDQGVKPSGRILALINNCSPFIEHKINLDRTLGKSPAVFRE